jgi:hypothetical protein
MWCIFVSMTTVGYGDFYAKTHIGRFITIIACIIGIYFVSMMMVFMTQKSVLTENETKAYKLVTRLKLRNEIKNIQATMILHIINMSIFTKKKYAGHFTNREYEIKYNYEKRNINNLLQQVKDKTRIISSFDLIATKEHLFDISERIDSDIKEIRQELSSLRFINETLIQFTDSQIDINKYLKKNLYATKLLYMIIEKKPVFGKLNNVDQSLQHLFEADINKFEFDDGVMEFNGNEDENDEENYEDNIFNYDVSRTQVKEFFRFLFSKNNARNVIF